MHILVRYAEPLNVKQRKMYDSCMKSQQVLLIRHLLTPTLIFNSISLSQRCYSFFVSLPLSLSLSHILSISLTHKISFRRLLLFLCWFLLSLWLSLFFLWKFPLFLWCFSLFLRSFFLSLSPLSLSFYLPLRVNPPMINVLW